MYNYKASGLPSVWLENGYYLGRSGDHEFFHIDHIKDLHDAIGLCLTEKDSILSPDEFRYLRTEMNLSRSNLGQMLGVSQETIKKWECGTNPVQKAADVLLRSLYLENASGSIKGMLEEINSLERRETMIHLSKTSQGWVKESV